MIIDSHVHLVSGVWEPEAFFIGVGRIAAERLKRSSPDAQSMDPGQLIKMMLPMFDDPEGDKLVKDMDASGVDKSIALVLDYDLGCQDSGLPLMGISIEDKNRRYVDAAKKHSGRIIPFFGVDPRRPEAVKLFEKFIEEGDVKGLKLHPTAGFYPDADEVKPLAELCVKHDLPVLFHTGTQPAPLKAKFARPIYIDSLAGDFPDLKIIAAHLAHMWWEELLMLAETKPNIYVDFSGWQMMSQEVPDEFYKVLRRYLDGIGAHRVFWGSDGPYLNTLLPVKKWKKAITDPPDEVNISDDEKADILGGAVARILNI